jgi:hypothetical protein
VLIETFSENGKVEDSEQSVTENISPKGAAVLTSLNLPIGRLIRLSSNQGKISVYAAVRGSSMGSAGVPRIHVEFVDGEWPL